MANTEVVKLEVYPRTKTGKSGAYRARLQELIPAVIYGSGIQNNKEGIPINLDMRNFRKVYSVAGKSTVVDLDTKDGVNPQIAGSKILIKEIQTHSFKNKVIHVDLLQLDLKKPIRVTVPLTFVGKAAGVAEGGIFSILNRSAEIRCLPTAIPHDIEVDISGIELNGSMKISEVETQSKDKGWEFIYESDYAVAAVLEPQEEEPTPQEAAAAAAEGAAAPAAGAAPAKKEEEKK